MKNVCMELESYKIFASKLLSLYYDCCNYMSKITTVIIDGAVRQQYIIQMNIRKFGFDSFFDIALFIFGENRLYWLIIKK